MNDKVQKALEERKKRQEEEKKQATASYEQSKSRVDDALAARAARNSQDVDETFINTFLSDANRFLSSAADDYKKVGWGNASSTYQSRNSTWEDLSSRFTKVRGWLLTNKDKLDADTYSSLSETLDSIRTGSYSVMDGFKSANDFYSQWETEDQYNFWKDHSTVESRQEWYDEQNRRLEELKAEVEAGSSDRVTARAEELYRTGKYAHRLGAVQDAWQEVEDEIASIEAEINNYKRGNYNEAGQYYGSKVVDDYSEYANRSDFGAVSANRDFTNATRENLWDYDMSALEGSEALSNGGEFDEDGNIRDSKGNIVHYANAPVVEDKLGMFLQTSEDEITEAYNALVATNGNYTNTWANLIQEGDQGSWDQLTTNEIAIYYYLLNNSGQETAYKYLADMNTELNRRATTKDIADLTDYYDEANLLEKIALNVASVPLQLVSGVAGFIEDTTNTIMGNEINPYSVAHSGMHFSNTVRNETAEDINGYNGGKIPILTKLTGFTVGDAYQAGMSILDSYAAIGIGGALGGALLATSAASSEAARLYEQGASMNQIALGSAAAGAAEMIFEKISIDNLIKMKDAKSVLQAVKNALVQGGIEASEEGFTEIANILTNSIIMGSQSDWAKLVEEYNGDTNQAFLAKVRDVVNAGIGGFLSGTGSAGVPSTVSAGANAIGQQVKYANTGKAINYADGGVDALLKLANEVSGASEGKTQKTLNKGIASVSKNAGNVKVGKLYDTVKTANNLANASQNKADIIKSLTRKGLSTGTATSIADALIAQYNGKELTKYQTKLLESVENNSAVKAAVSNIMANANSTMGQRSQNIRDFERDIDTGVVTKAVFEATGIDRTGKKTAAEEFTPKGEYEVSDNTKAFRTDTKEDIDVKGVASISDGEMLLDIGNGKTINSKDVAYASKQDALVYEAIANLGDKIDPKTANELFAMYDGKNAALFARGIAQAYSFGFHGYDKSELANKSSFASDLTVEQRNAAYRLGKDYRPVKDRNDKSNAHTTKAPAEKGVYYRDQNGNATDISTYLKSSNVTLNERQKTAIEAMRKFSETMGARFNVFESWEENGKRYYLDENGVKTQGNPNGFYDPKTGEIYIALDAGADSSNKFRDTMLFTIAHEMTHFMKQWSPEHFTKISRIVFAHAGFKGHVSELVASKMADRKKKGKPISYDTAVEEVVADAMETILKDGKVVEFMAEVKQKDHTAWQKLKGWFKNLEKFLRKLVVAYRGEHANTTEGDMVANFAEDVLRQIEQVFAEGAVAAGENYQAAEVQENTTEAGSVKMMVRENTDIPYKQYRKLLNKKPLKDSSKYYYKVKDARIDKYRTLAEKDIPDIDFLEIAEYNIVDEGYVYTIRNYDKFNFAILGRRAIKTKYDGYVMEVAANGDTGETTGKGNDGKGSQLGGHETGNRLPGDQGAIQGDAGGGQEAGNADQERSISHSDSDNGRGGINTPTSTEAMDVEVDDKTESVAPTVLKSERTWTESDYVQEREVAAQEIAKAIGVSVKKAKAYIDSVNSIAKMIAEDRVRLDYFSSPGRSSFVGNVEYGGSFDFSTLCKKRRLLTGTFTAIQKALPNTALTADEILDIRNRMKEKGLEVSCGLCYVEGSRANMGQFAKEFLRLYKQYYPDAWQPNMADVNTPDGIEWVRINHPECYEQYEYFWNHYGTLKEGDKNLFASQQKPKLYQLHTEYKGEILEKFDDDDNVEEKNLNGGIRLQSFSDFEIVHLIDTMQIIMDMSRVGLAGQAYTKVPDFAWALGDTGLKINLSLIAKGVDENGRLIFDDVEGMPIDKAVELRNRYSKNVGTILVAFNDEQLLAAMADKRVDYIIPFHRSQWKKSQYGAMGLPAKTKDYTYMQNEKFIKPQFHEYRGRMVQDKATNYMPNEYWDFSKSGKENAEAYLEMCARNNKRPKFYKLLQNNGDGSYSLKADGSTDGYWKLLIDFKMYDNDGNGSPQMPVKPDFNMDEATRMLNEYSGGHSNFPVAQGIVDDFVQEYKDSHKGTLFSDRDSDGNSLTAEQSAFFAQSKVRDDHGRLIPMYHGTNTPNFTVFDPQQSDDHISLFFTSDPDVANTYTQQQDKGRDVDPYNLITKNSSAEQFNAAQERVGGGLRVVKITSGWIQEMKAKAEKSATRLFGVANKYADLLAYNNSTGMFDYDIKRIREITGKGIENLKQDDINKLRKAMGDAEQHSFFAQDHKGATKEIRRTYLDNFKLFDEVWNYKVVADTPDSAIGQYTYTETNSSVPFMADRNLDFLGHIIPGTEKEMVAKALDRMQWVEEHNLGNRYKVYLNITNPYIIDAGINYSGKMDRVSLERSTFGEGWRVSFENAEHDVIKHMTTSDFNAFIESAFDAKTTAKIKAQIEADNEAYRKEWGDDFYEDMDVGHDIQLRNVQMEYMEPGNWNALNFNGNENARTRDVAAWAKEKGYDGVIFKNMKDAGGYAFMKGRGGSTVATAFSSEQVKSVDNKNPTSDPDIRFSDRDGASNENSPAYTGEYPNGVRFQHREDNPTKLKMLNDQVERGEYTTVYKALLKIGDTYYPPMASLEKDENGRYTKLRGGQKLFDWIASDGKLTDEMKAKMKMKSPKAWLNKYADAFKDGRNPWGMYGDFNLKKADESGKSQGAVPAAYNPYQHSSDQVLNDQFEAAYDRPGLVVVECRIPNSELTDPYWAPYAKDPTGMHEWKTGPIAGQLKKTTRHVYMTRWIQPVRELSAREVAEKIRDIVAKEDTPPRVYWNTISPKVLPELIKLGVEIDPYGSPNHMTSENAVDMYGNLITDEIREARKAEKEAKKSSKNTKKASKEAVLYQDRDTDSVSNRSLLANAFDGITKPEEKQKVQEYKGNINLINAEERKLHELNEKIKELSFAKGPKDIKAIRDLQFEARQTANRISTYDKILLRLEASKPLQDVLTREKKMAYQRAEKKGKEALADYREKTMQTQRELLKKWQDSRKKGIDSRNRTAMRHKIKDIVNELNQYLLRGTKDRHVPIELQKAVAEALDAVNMDTVGAEERIAKLQDELLKAKTPEQIQEIARKIDHIQQMGDKMNGRLQKLKDAYDQFVNSDDPMIANSHDEVISNKLQSVIDSIGNTPLRDMTLAQLEDVYDMYRMVLTTIRNANKAFKAKKSESISTIANRVMEEVEQVGGKKKLTMKGMDGVKRFVWNNLKPVYAFEHIGSDTFTEVFNAVRSGEDVWAVDVTEAREFYLDKSKKHGYNSWDFKKRYNFKSTSGMEFSLDLEQIMSLYAYSKRDQAADHLKKGGIVIDETTEITIKNKLGIPVKFNPTEATAYNISEPTLAEIISKLTDEQKRFVDEMQDYLSTVMGAKGNEVSLEMYGIKLFKEKFYFPLKSAQQFMAKAKEQQKGEVKIKNSGFSKETVQKASNPIVLTPFMNVWADHVNEMSMYHAFVLPMEDFYRVYNYKTPTSETMATESVEMFIQNAYGKGATGYIDQLLKDLNGGARTDSTTGFINKMMGLFKKGAVFASLSVVVQQPSAIARAAALVDTKYFIGPKVDHKRHKALWDEVKQYAPVAIIKEMGYFDTNMGKSTQDFILAKEYPGFKEKMSALVTDSGFRDEALSKAPALADEIAWCSIWEAVKRETQAKYPGMDVKGEPFLKLAGSRFTEVIVKTQVYDSVLSRSGLMRSKDTGMKMATAFMAEPTTSINMIADALLQGKRGNWKYARTAIGAVIASQILNSILVSFVYAGRDDDEDETYVEKYIGTLAGEILDSLNPAGYIPFIKDIMSIVQGYDVERSDMAVVSDLWNAIQNLTKDNVSVYRKVEGFAGSIAQIFGLPVKNIMRDARGIYQTVMSFVNGQQTTAAGIGYAVKGAITGKTVSDQQQLYEAYLSGDQTQIARVKGRFKDQSAINSAIRKALRENDPRIKAAAVARYNGNLTEYTRLAKEIIAEKHFSQDDVVAAINAEINAMDKGETSSSTPKASGLYKAEDFAVAIANGDQAMANAVKTDIIRTAQKNGKSEEEAVKSFNSSAASSCKELFLEGKLSEDQAVDALATYCGKTEDEAMADVQYWAFKQDYPDVYADDSWFDKYYEDIADSGIEIDVYMDYRNQVKGIDGDGKKEKRMAIIHSLPITSAQKDALYFAEGWAASKLYEAPWH